MLKFDKCHGLGNDYIYVDAATLSFEKAQELAPSLCKRGAGVGADGIILIGQDTTQSVIMKMLNADGSEGLMCGNGARCVAHLAKRWGWLSGDEVTIHTAAGERHAVIKNYSPEESQVTVDMGFPVFGGIGYWLSRR